MNQEPNPPPAPFASGKRRELLWALASRIVPPVETLDDAATEEFFAILETALAERPPAMRRQFALFLRVIQVLSIATRLRTFGRLGPESRDRLLASIERSPIPILRKGFWGLKTLLAMGFYTQPRFHASLGYQPRLRGGGLRAALS